MKYSNMWQAVKYLFTIFVSILVPVYSYSYGWQNFLWLSDIGLFLTLIALWLQSTLIMSMAAVGILILELVWCVDYFMDLLFNINPITLSDYMFDNSLPIALRAISLFHVITPVIWLGYLYNFGYNKKALNYFIPLYWVVVIATFLLTNPEYDINWVFLPKTYGMNMPAILWPLTLCVVFPVVIFMPTHLAFCKLFKKT